MSELTSESLPFSVQRQQALLGHCIFNDRVYGQVGHLLQPNWFSGDFNQALFQALQSWHKATGRHPTPDELWEAKDFSGYDPAKKLKLNGHRGLLLASIGNYGADVLLAEVGAWMKARLLQSTLPKVIQAYKNEKIDESVSIINGMVNQYFKLNVNGRPEATFEGYGSELLSQNENSALNGCSFGLKLMDDILDSSGAGRPLAPGDMTILLAPSNIGKTSSLITTAVHNILLGKSVLYVAHEGTIADLKDKFMRCLTGLTRAEQVERYKTSEGAAQMAVAEAIFANQWTFVPFFEPGATVEDVSAVIEQYQEKRKSTTGSGYDLLIDDYPAKLTTKTAAGGHLQFRHIQEAVYNYFVQLGLKHEFHVLVALQTNREASKKNRKSGAYGAGDALVTLEDAAEAWGPICSAATVISLNRDPTDAENEVVSLLLCKSRSSETGVVVVANSDYTRARVFSNDLGSYWYRGEFGLGKNKKAVMKAFCGKLVPAEKIKLYTKF
jgi:hypothetical protein